jgi:hypothetical protein
MTIMSKTQKKKLNGKHFTNGQLNRLIDDVCHPLYKVNKGFVLIDGALHALAEKDLPKSLKKFTKYNFDTIVKEIRKWTE